MQLYNTHTYTPTCTLQVETKDDLSTEEDCGACFIVLSTSLPDFVGVVPTRDLSSLLCLSSAICCLTTSLAYPIDHSEYSMKNVITYTCTCTLLMYISNAIL